MGHRVTSPVSNPAPAWAPLSMGPHIPPGACSFTGSPQGHSLLWASTYSGVASSTGCRWVSAPLLTSMGCRGTACLTMVCSTGFRGTSAPEPGAPPHPPSSLTLVSPEFSLLSLAEKFCYAGVCFFFHNYVIPEALPLLLIGLVLACSRSVLELVGIGSVGHGGSF